MDTLPHDILPCIFTSCQTILTYRLVNHYADNLVRQVLVQFMPLKYINRTTNHNLSYFSNARFVDLSMCRLITDHGLIHLSNVEILNLSGCHKITDHGLEYLQSVRKINLTGCFRITADGLDLLSSRGVQYCRMGWRDFLKYAHDPSIPDILHNKIIRMGDMCCDKKESDLIEKVLSDDDSADEEQFTSNFVYDSGINDKKNNISFRVISLSKKMNKSKIIQKVIDIIKTQEILCNKVLMADVETKNQMLKNYLVLQHPDLRPFDQSKEKLYAINPFMEKFCLGLKNRNIDAMIAGSTGLYCVYTGANFVPADLDIYIKNFSAHDLYLIEDIIYQTIDIEALVVIRSQITITFYILTRIPNKKIYSIQVNILDFSSWTEVFVTYHSSLTCIGYEVLTDQFLFMENKWEHTLTRKTNYFTNVSNFSSDGVLLSAANKYHDRGFKCRVVTLTTYTRRIPYSIPYSFHSSTIDNLRLKYYGSRESGQVSEYPNISKNDFSKLLLKYKINGTYAIATSAIHLYEQNEKPISSIYLSLYMIDKYSIPLDTEIGKKYFNRSGEIIKQYADNPNNTYCVAIYCPDCKSCISLLDKIDPEHFCNCKDMNVGEFLCEEKSIDMTII